MLKPGERLGPYTIASPLGAGGMGEVYRAHDARLDRDVAIKVLPSEVAQDPDRLARFEREAKALAALSHPNILGIHDFGREGEVTYAVMELLEGKTLRERLAEERLPWRKAAEVAAAVADGLAAAHAHGIVHRDLKPDNLFITCDCVVKILDFGLAKSVEAQGAGGPPSATTVVEATEAGLVVGTVGYMSPEQVRGEAADHRSDIFALGCVLYEMLTGTRAFKRDTVPETLSATLAEPLPEPSLTAAEVPPELDRVVAHCLEKRPDERFQSARDLAFDLRALATPVPHAAAPTPVARRRSRLAWLALGAVVLAACAALVWRWSGGAGRHGAGEQRERVAVLPFENLGAADDAYFATGVTDEITGRLASVRGLAVISRASAIQYAGTTKRTKQIGSELGVGYLVTGTVRWARGPGTAGRVRITPQLIRVADDTSQWAEVYEFAIDDIFRVQSEIAQSVTTRLGLTLLEHERGSLEAAPTGNLPAYQAFLRGRFIAGQPHFTLSTWLSALGDFERATELDPRFALAWAELSRGHARLVYYRYDMSAQRRDQAHRALERARELAPNSPDVRLASGYYHLWVERDPAAALTEFEAASEGLPNNAEVQEAKGELFRLRGDWQRALEAFQIACSLSPRDASPMVEVTETCWCMRRYPEALAAADRAIALAPDQAWPHLAKVYTLWSWKGRDGLRDSRAAAELVPKEHEFALWTWFWQEAFEGRYAEALRVLDGSPGEWIRLKIEAVPKLFFAALAHGWKGEIGRAKGEFEAARPLLEAEVQAAPDDGRYHSSLAVVYAALGRREEAVREAKRGVELLPLSADPVYGIPHVIDLAHVYVLLGEPDEAIAQLDVLLSNPGWISVAWLEADPRWEPLRSNPGFRALLAKHQVRR
jgi:TolB-like protein/Flp pilus assembly protein TadD